MKTKVLLLLSIVCGVIFYACTKPVDDVVKVKKTVFYRLKQVDKDGKVTYSQIISTKE